MKTGFLLVGHGTRNKRGQLEFLQLAQRIAEGSPDQIIRPAFLELAEPTISQSVALLREAGVERIVCIPIILLAAGHVKQDIPAAVQAAASECGIESVTFLEHLGCRPAMLELSAARFREAVPHVESSDVGWVLVGRGTRDESALAEIDRFRELRQEIMATGESWLGFLAMAEPTLSDVMEAAANSSAETIVVQPHLLFEGDLLNRTKATVDEFSARYPRKSWFLAKHLGPDELIVRSMSSDISEIVLR